MNIFNILTSIRQAFCPLKFFNIGFRDLYYSPRSFTDGACVKLIAMGSDLLKKKMKISIIVK